MKKKWAEYMKMSFAKDKRQMADKHMRTCLIWHVIRERQTKTIVRDYSIPMILT